MLKTYFQTNEQKGFVYRDYTSFSKNSFLTDLSNSIENSQCSEAFKAKIFEVLDKHAPRETKLLRGNYKSHVSKKLKKKDNEKISVKKYCKQDS